MRLVKWKNLWNYMSEEGGTTRLHLTESDTLTGTTLCGREYPRCKGYPTAVHYCKVCVKKSKLTSDQLRGLEYVPNAFD